MRGYQRQTSGVLEIVELLVIDGKICDRGGYPLDRTDETDILMGWPDEGRARIYKTDGGVDVLVPEQD